MANSDGSVVIRVNLNDKQAQAELNRLTKEIDKLQAELSKNQNDQSSIKAKLEAAKAEALRAEQAVLSLMDRLKAESANLDDIASGRVVASPEELAMAEERYIEITSQLNEQRSILSAQDKEAARLEGQYERISSKIIEQKTQLGELKDEAGEYVEQISKVGPAAKVIKDAADKMEKSAARFTKRLKTMLKSALVFTVFSRALGRFRDYMGNVIKANSEATNALARLKGALLTLAQPLLQVLIPAFTTFVELVTKIATAIGRVMSQLFGTTYEQSQKAAESLYNESDALDKTGKSAKKATKSLAAFDEINRLSGTENKSDKVAPDFTSNEALSGKEARGILGLITSIGALLLGLRLSDSLISGLQTAVGLALAFQGAIKFISSLLSTWLSGLDWDNFLGMLVGAAALVAGLALAFGKVGAAIGLIITGIAELVAGFRDADINGWNLKNTLLTITGMISSGLGISLLTGSWIPLIIAGILSVVLAITVATGHGKELIDGLKTAVSGFKDFFIRVFEGDIPAAIQRLRDAFGGLTEATSAVLDGFRDMFNNLLSLIEYVGNKIGIDLSGIIQVGKNYISNFFGILKEAVSESMSASARILQGLIEFISGTFTQEWETAWAGIKDVLAGILNGIITLFEAVTNLCRNKINSILDMLQELTSFTLPDWLGGHEFGGIDIPRLDKIKIPRLATGAVIPPNREFLAVLGDQKQGNNIEAPAAAIEAAVARGMAQYGGGNQTAILKIGEQELGRIIFKLNKDQTQRVGVQLT